MNTPSDDDRPFVMPTCLVFDPVGTNDEQALWLVRTGYAWKGGPVTQRRLVLWLVRHPEVELDSIAAMPVGVAAYVTAARS